MKRKTSSIILSLALCISFAVPAAAADYGNALVWTVAPTLEYGSIEYHDWHGYHEWIHENPPAGYESYDNIEISPKTGAILQGGYGTGGYYNPYTYYYVSIGGTEAYFREVEYDIEFVSVKEIVQESKSRTLALMELTPIQGSGFNAEILKKIINRQEYVEWYQYLDYGKTAVYSNGKRVTDHIYDYVYSGNAIAFAAKDSKYAFVDVNGKQLTGFIYDSICGYAMSGHAMEYFSVSKGGKWGFVDQSGKELIPFIFDGAVYIDGNTAFAKYNGKYGILDVKKTAASLTPTEKPSSWAEAEVNSAIAAKLVPQSLQSKYTQATTRAEFCALAVALYENVKGKITGRKTFTDTSDINVEKCAYIGVVNGMNTTETIFSPDVQLTREQAATMLARLANAIGKPLKKQESLSIDKNSFSSWAAEAVGQVQGVGIMTSMSTSSNVFSPKTSYTREQSIITIMRLYNIIK